MFENIAVFLLALLLLLPLRSEGEEKRTGLPNAKPKLTDTKVSSTAVPPRRSPQSSTVERDWTDRTRSAPIRVGPVEGCDPSDSSLGWLNSTDSALQDLAIGKSQAFQNICVPPSGVNSDLIITDFNPESTDPTPETSYRFGKLICQRETAARLVCTVDLSKGVSPNAEQIQSFRFPSVQLGIQPCASWLTPESYRDYRASCDQSPANGLFKFDALAPIGSACRMTLCRHEASKEWLPKPFWGYALGYDQSCCTHANFSEWSDSEDNGQWTCQLRGAPNSPITLDCQGSNTAKAWADFGGWCSVFNSIPVSESSCWTWAPDMDKAPYPVCPPSELTDSGCSPGSNLLCCPRYVAYGKDAADNSEIYAIQPFALCNVSGSGKARYVLETTPGSLFTLSLPDPDTNIPFNWYCAVGNSKSAVSDWKISWDSNKDGAITNACLSPAPGAFSGFITLDSPQPYACTAKGCSNVGFNPGVHIFQSSAPNGPGGKFSGEVSSLGFLTVQSPCLSPSQDASCESYKEDAGFLGSMARPLMDYMEGHLPIRGATHASCGFWSAFLEALLDPLLCQSLTGFNRARLCSVMPGPDTARPPPKESSPIER